MVDDDRHTRYKEGGRAIQPLPLFQKSIADMNDKTQSGPAKPSRKPKYRPRPKGVKIDRNSEEYKARLRAAQQGHPLSSSMASYAA